MMLLSGGGTLKKIGTKKTWSLIFFVLFIVFMSFVTVVIGRPMIRFVENPESFRNWVDAYGISGRIIFVFMVVFQVLVALIPGEPLEFGAGYAFGAVEGTILASLGILIGSIIVFYLVKKFGTALLEIFFTNEQIGRVKVLKQSRKRDILLFLLFLLPGTPKDLLTYFLGLTDIKLSTLIFLSVVGRFPSVISSTISGSALGRESYILASIVFLITLALSSIGLLIYNKICKNNNS